MTNSAEQRVEQPHLDKVAGVRQQRPRRSRAVPSAPRATVSGVTALFLLAGCQPTEADRAVRMTRGYVYYLDGAGGGSRFHNWAGGVRRGMKAAGYDGAGEMFDWETGRGVMADQTASVEYKRDKAAQLAQKIVAYKQQHPQAPVTLMGLSAGTAIAVFALEALPPGVSVDDVILLSGSLSSTHDLTPALRHVSKRVYIFTSQHDAVLQFLVPISGTADREADVGGTIGVNGARLPRRASAETRSLYAKVTHVPWRPEFARLGNRGGHTDSVDARFVQAVVAPLVGSISGATVATANTSGDVPNPDYQRWQGFEPGSWVLLRGNQIIDGTQQPLIVKATLVSRDRERLIVHRDFIGPDGGTETPLLQRRFVVAARIHPGDHPLTHPQRAQQSLPPQEFVVRGVQLTGSGLTLKSKGNSLDWGRDAEAAIYESDAIPGGMVDVRLKTHLDGQTVEFDLRTDDFYVAPKTQRP